MENTSGLTTLERGGEMSTMRLCYDIQGSYEPKYLCRRILFLFPSGKIQLHIYIIWFLLSTMATCRLKETEYFRHDDIRMQIIIIINIMWMYTSQSQSIDTPGCMFIDTPVLQIKSVDANFTIGNFSYYTIVFVLTKACWQPLVARYFLSVWNNVNF